MGRPKHVHSTAVKGHPSSFNSYAVGTGQSPSCCSSFGIELVYGTMLRLLIELFEIIEASTETNL